MKVYLYTYAYENIKKEGYKSLAMFDKDNEDTKKRLLVHRSSAKSENTEDIIAYLEQTFKGRLRSICVITDVAPQEEYKHPYLNNLVHHADVISFDLDELIANGIVEAVYCKDLRETILTNPSFENIYKVNNINDIDYKIIRNYLIYLNDKNYKSASISRNLSSLRKFFKYLIDYLQILFSL